MLNSSKMENKKINSANLQERIDQLKSNLNGFHNDALQATDKMIDISLASGAQWQKLMAKVLHKGTDLLERQQDITLNTLEAAKKQYVAGSKQIIQLLGIDQTKAKKAATLRKSSSKKSANTSPAIDDLKIVQGIGPKVEALLNDANINSLEELVNTPTENLKSILENAGSRYQAIDPTTWIEQAQEVIANGNPK